MLTLFLARRDVSLDKQSIGESAELCIMARIVVDERTSERASERTDGGSDGAAHERPPIMRRELLIVFTDFFLRVHLGTIAR